MGYRVELISRPPAGGFYRLRLVRTARAWPAFWRTRDVSEAEVTWDGTVFLPLFHFVGPDGGRATVDSYFQIEALERFVMGMGARRNDDEQVRRKAWRPVSQDRSGGPER